MRERRFAITRGVRCCDCRHCNPLTDVPNLDYMRRPFLSTCEHGTRMLMYREIQCSYFEQKDNDNEKQK